MRPGPTHNKLIGFETTVFQCLLVSDLSYLLYSKTHLNLNTNLHNLLRNKMMWINAKFEKETKATVYIWQTWC